MMSGFSIGILLRNEIACFVRPLMLCIPMAATVPRIVDTVAAIRAMMTVFSIACRTLHVAGEEIAVQFCRETGPVAKDLAFGEREYGDEYYRRIEDYEQKPDVTLCEESFHSLYPPFIKFFLVVLQQAGYTYDHQHYQRQCRSVVPHSGVDVFLNDGTEELDLVVREEL